MTTITIDNSPYEVEADSLELSLSLGLAGSKLNFALTPGQSFPPMKKKVSLQSLAGIDFEGILDDDNSGSKGTHLAPLRYSAIGKQFLLNRDTVNVAYKGLTQVSEILSELLFDSGVGGTIIGEDRMIRGFAYKGKMTEALQALALRSKCMLFMSPDAVELIDRDDAPAVGLNWIYGATVGWNNLEIHPTIPNLYSQIVIEGGVPKLSDDDPDEEEVQIAHTGTVNRTRFGYPRKIDEIYDVTVDGESVFVCQEGDPEQETFDAYNDSGEREIIFNTPPAEGAEIILYGRIQRARGKWDDSAFQSYLSTNFGGNGILPYLDSRPEIRTQLEAAEFAEFLAPVILADKHQCSAEVWANTLFWPGRMVTVTDSRRGYSQVLQVQQNSIKYRSHLGRWLQSVTVGNGQDGDVLGSPTGYLTSSSVGAGVGNQYGQQPPTATSAANETDFTITVTPETQNVTDGTSGPATFTIEVAPVGGFNKPVTLEKIGLPGTTATWTPDNVILGGSGTRTLELTPTDGTWTDGEAGEEGTFLVKGTAGPKNHTADGEVVIDPEPECTGDYTIIIGNYNPSCPSCETHLIQFKAISNNPGCVGQTVSIQIQNLTGIGPDHPCYPVTSDWWTVSASEFDVTIAASEESATPVEIAFFPNGQEQEGCGPNNRSWCGPPPLCSSQTTYAAFTATGPDGIPQIGCFMVSNQGGC